MRQLARTPEDTLAAGARLAAALPPPAAAAAVVHLQGELGAGKTTLARGFLAALGHTGAVRSPTYTLLERYELPPLTVVHADLYRLHEPGELENLGLRELAQPWHVWLIEWPERAGAALPAPDLLAHLAAGTDAHTIDLRAHTDFGRQWLARPAARTPA